MSVQPACLLCNVNDVQDILAQANSEISEEQLAALEWAYMTGKIPDSQIEQVREMILTCERKEIQPIFS